jgi:2-polyprenyl-6-methoxyphenol hydroxylase-like FAD-dependent oxidoreductase
MRDRSVLISGAGIAGPTAAYWLAERGFAPVLLEHAQAPRSGGYVIDFWGLGYDIAERMGLLRQLRRESYDVLDVRFVAADGRRVGGFGVDVFRRLTGGRYVTIPRSALAHLLFRSIADRCETIFGDAITAIEERNDGLEVAFNRAAPRRFDLVIGADGLHSAVRAQVFGPEQRFEVYLGYAVAAFEIAGYSPRDEQAYVSHAQPGRQVARFAMRDGRTLILFVFRADQPPHLHPHDLAGAKAAVRTAFAGVGWECPRILAALDDSEDLYFDRVSQIRLPAWSRGRTALIGDAAFCPSLLAGQGAALAMTAAYVLAGELAAADAHDAAFARFEQILRPFIDRKQSAARRFAGFFAPRTIPGLWLRNQMSKLLALHAIADVVARNGLIDDLPLPTYAST